MYFISKTLFALLFVLPITIFGQSSPVGDWKTMVPDGQGGMLPLKVSIKTDGTFAGDFGMDGTVEFTGKYTIDGDKITIQNDSGDCTGKGVYTFKIEGSTMVNKRISDECSDRGGPDGKMTWTKLQ